MDTTDELLDDVIIFFDNSDEDITVSTIQRKFKLGYNRACCIVEQIKIELKKRKDSFIRQKLNEKVEFIETKLKNMQR